MAKRRFIRRLISGVDSCRALVKILNGYNNPSVNSQFELGTPRSGFGWTKPGRKCSGLHESNRSSSCSTSLRNVVNGQLLPDITVFAEYSEKTIDMKFTTPIAVKTLNNQGSLVTCCLWRKSVSSDLARKKGSHAIRVTSSRMKQVYHLPRIEKLTADKVDPRKRAQP